MQVGSDELAVLVVAGDPTGGRDLAAAIAAEYGPAEVVTAVGVEEAIERLHQFDHDGCVLDLGDLGVYPPDAVEELTGEAPDTPVVVVDAGTVDCSRRVLLEHGAADAMAAVDTDDAVALLVSRLRMAVEAADAHRTATETRQRYHRLLETAPVAIVIYDAGGVIQYANPAATALVGAEDPHDLAGRVVFEFVDPEYRDLLEGRFERIIEDRERARSLEIALVGLDGETRYVEAAGTPVTIDGEPGGQTVLTEVTALKERELALQRQNERLDAFASIVSHDLKSPLSVAKGNLDLAREVGGTEYVEKADAALDRMTRIIDDLLRLARSGEQSIDEQLIDGATVVTEAWAAVDDDDGALLTNAWDQRVLADRGQLRELLVNLLRNSVEHTDGDVRIEVGDLDAADRTTGFYVADDGPGIPESERSDIFDPGYTTHENGTGFGLLVVDEIARAHGWEITVTESQYGGARFEFTGVDGPDPT